jgi:anti-sigma factor RsiW
MVKDEAELASLEEHLLACPACVEGVASTQDYVDAIRAALVTIRED